MLNQYVIIGRMLSIYDLNDNTGNSIMTISVIKLNSDEEDSYNNIKFLLKNNLSTNAKAYFKEKDLVGIRGYIDTDEDENIVLVADKITFLSQRKE